MYDPESDVPNEDAKSEIFRRAEELHRQDLHSQVNGEVSRFLAGRTHNGHEGYSTSMAIALAVEALDWYGHLLERRYPETAKTETITLTITRTRKVTP